jgi:mRNA interferase YafQ
MTREIRITPRFKRSFRKFIQQNTLLRSQVQKTLYALSQDAFAPSLDTHKQKGELYNLQACSCGYDCRIIFRIETDTLTNKEYILLVDIGSHDEVY